MKALITIAVVGLGLAAFGLASAAERGAPWVYRETAVFNHVVGPARFVGNFLAAPGRCDVTLFETHAQDGDLRQPLRRYAAPIAAGGRRLFSAGSNAALAISCAPRADAIGVEAEAAAVETVAP
jgi:hypothetical protein